MQLRSGKIVISSNAKGNIELRSGKVIIRSKYTPRSYIKRKKNIELRSGRLVSYEKYTPRPYIKRKKTIELRSGRLISRENYKKRPYTKRINNVRISISEYVPTPSTNPMLADAHTRAMLDHYKYNHLGMYDTLSHLTNSHHRKTVDMIRNWQVSEQHRNEYLNLKN